VPFRGIREDIRMARQNDPAARSSAEVFLAYSGVHAVWGYRVSHRLWAWRWFLVARIYSQVVRSLTGVEIHPGATIGRRLFIDHGMGVVIGETAVVGDDVVLYHGVTLGGTSSLRERRHPTIGDRVTVGAGASVLGPVSIGHDSVVGANAVVVRDAPPNSVLTGIPARVRPRTTTSVVETFTDPAIYI
jgi:serine O-acetyltransferase